MAVTLGINPITWTNDDMPELGGDTPLDVCLAEARLAGYAGIELGGKFPRQAAVLRPILAAHDLALISGWYSAHLCRRSVAEEQAAVTDHLDLLVAMGCRVMVFAEGHGSTDSNPAAPLSARPVLSDAEWPAFCEKLNEVARHLRRRGVRLAFHHHMGTVVQTEAEMDRLMANTNDDVGLLLDTGHLAFAGGDPVAVARRHGSAHRARALQGRARGSPDGRAARRSQLPARGARWRVHGPRRRFDRFSRSACASCGAPITRAGSSSKPSRIRRLRIRSRMHEWASRI